MFEWYTEKSLVIIGFGVIAVVAFAVIVNYSRSVTYPDLSSTDSLNDVVAGVEKERGAAFVTFSGEKKYRIPWADNIQYEGEFRRLSSAISPGDVILKKAFSDTIVVKHEEKKYTYVLEKAIGR
ncbi:hypothetical protein SAMN04488109_0062 [Chryseolinea serpens]|uniref:Uncharacterized protein n=2 Tax=Chryseolinea serpens TaxID=947013 RepID=A0A1M5JHE2_9BACT|nr:hypothetical protein SAMN04488109_0062 [Chryseolinea serpens]